MAVAVAVCGVVVPVTVDQIVEVAGTVVLPLVRVEGTVTVVRDVDVVVVVFVLVMVVVGLRVVDVRVVVALYVVVVAVLVKLVNVNVNVKVKFIVVSFVTVRVLVLVVTVTCAGPCAGASPGTRAARATRIAHTATTALILTGIFKAILPRRSV